MAIRGWRWWRALALVLAVGAFGLVGCKSEPAGPPTGSKAEPTGPHAAMLKLFPGAGDVTDWKAQDAPKFFGPVGIQADAVEPLEMDAGTSAAVIRSYDYTKSATRNYVRGAAGEKVTVRLYEMKSPSEAYGLFSVRSSGNQFPLVGLAARMSNTNLGFVKGTFFVSVDYSGTMDSTPVLMEFGRWIADHITAPGFRPSLLESFPAQSVQGERYYLHKFDTLASLPFVPKGDPVQMARVLDLGPDTDVAVMGYSTDTPGVLNYLFVIKYPTEAEAQAAYTNYEAYLAASTIPAEHNIAIAPAVRFYVAGTFNAEENSVKDQLAKLLAALGG
jgi:hypothetical protein